MLFQWLFKDCFAMVANGLIVVALTIILHAVMRPILRNLALGDYEEFLRVPTNYVVQERPTANHSARASFLIHCFVIPDRDRGSTILDPVPNPAMLD